MMQRAVGFAVVLALGFQAIAGADEAAGSRNVSNEAYQPMIHPSWEDQELGRIHYSNSGNQRRGDDSLIFRINEDGVVSGSDLLGVVPGLDFETFQTALSFGLLREGDSSQAQAQNADPRAQYDQFMQRKVDEGMAALVMARILDHEAMKRRMPPEVSEERVNYVVRAVLTQNGLATRRDQTASVRPMRQGSAAPMRQTTQAARVSLCGPAVEIPVTSDEDLSGGVALASEAEMYRWLKETYGEQPLRFNMDWQFDQVGLGESLRLLGADPSELNWPAVTLDVGVLPRNLRLFRAAVKAKLDEQYRPILRAAVWQRIVAERNPLAQTRQGFVAPTQAEIDRLYPLMRETPLIRTDRTKVDVSEISLQGEKAEAFKARLMAVLEEKSSAFQRDLFGDGTALVEQSPEVEAQLRLRIIEWRKTAATEAFAQVRAEFESDIASGALSAGISSCSIEKTSAQLRQNSSAGSSYLANAETSVFDLAFGSMQLLPVIEGSISAAGGQSLMMAVVSDQQTLDPTYLEIQDPRVRRVFRERARSRELARVHRQVAYELFSENPFEFRINTCEQVEWPCATSNRRNQAVKWTDLLFQEFLFPEMTLPVEVSRMPLQTTTLLRPEYFDRVMTLSSEGFERVISAPNTHVDRVLRFFPGLRQAARMSPERSSGNGSVLSRILGQRSMSCGPNGCGF